MPLTLPTLDDVTWADLNEEARALIPGLAPDWTNFNPSDPGITLVELLAHFTEILLFRTDQITDAQTIQFLRLLNGPAWRPRTSLDAERQATLLSFGLIHRAVTAGEFERLAVAAIPTSAGRYGTLRHQVARAKCIVNRNLEAAESDARDADAPAHISVVIVTKEDPTPPPQTLRHVKKTLDEARLIATRVHVVGPSFVFFRVRLTLHLNSDTSTEWLSTAAMNRLQDFFDPLRGGQDEKGWPFGKPLFVSELYLLLSKIPGLEYAAPTGDDSGDACDEILLEPQERWRKHYSGVNELDSVELKPYELPRLEITPEDLVIKRKRAGR